jgi:hypothetical protein
MSALIARSYTTQYASDVCLTCCSAYVFDQARRSASDMVGRIGLLYRGSDAKCMWWWRRTVCPYAGSVVAPHTCCAPERELEPHPWSIRLLKTERDAHKLPNSSTNPDRASQSDSVP